MGTTIVLADPISPEDAAEIAGWGKDPAGVGFLNLVWRSKEQHVLVRAGGRPGHSRSADGSGRRPAPDDGAHLQGPELAVPRGEAG